MRRRDAIEARWGRRGRRGELLRSTEAEGPDAERGGEKAETTPIAAGASSSSAEEATPNLIATVQVGGRGDERWRICPRRNGTGHHAADWVGR